LIQQVEEVLAVRFVVIFAGLSVLAAACSPDAFDAASPDSEDQQGVPSETRTPGITPGDPLPNDGLQQNEPVEPSAAPAENEPGSGQ